MLMGNKGFQVKPIDNIKKAAIAGSVKDWLDEWIWKEMWSTLEHLARVDTHDKLLEVQAKARVMLNMFDSVKQDILNGKKADQMLQKHADLHE